MEKNPHADAMTSEAFTTPRSVRAAGRIVLRGKGPRVDLQDLHSATERDESLKIVMAARDKALPLMRQEKPNKEKEMRLSYDRRLLHSKLGISYSFALNCEFHCR